MNLQNDHHQIQKTMSDIKLFESKQIRTHWDENERLNKYKNEDEIENRKDGLLDEIEKRLKQQTTEQNLFTIRWKVI